MRVLPGNLTALAAILAFLGISPAIADGMPQFDVDALDPQAPVIEDALIDDEAGPQGIERLTFQPMREGPVDRVEPMEVLPLPAMSTDTADRALSSKAGDGERGAPVCDGQTSSGFVAVTGNTVGDTLAGWAACSGWTVRWDNDHTYVLEASADFSGDFVTAASALVGSFAKAEPPLFGEFYASNRVLVVTTPTELDHQ